MNIAFAPTAPLLTVTGYDNAIKLAQAVKGCAESGIPTATTMADDGTWTLTLMIPTAATTDPSEIARTFNRIIDRINEVAHSQM